MGRKTRNKITAEEYKYNKEYNKEYIKEPNEDHKTREEREEEERKEKRGKIYFLDLYDTLYEIFDEYQTYDSRIRWVSVSDILHGPLYSITVRDDDTIIDLVDVLFNQIKNFLIKSKKHIIGDDDDKFEMYIFSNLSRDIIYARIAYTINKWYIDQVYYDY
jgi:hypothetical protein